MYFILFSVLGCLSTCHGFGERDENQDHCAPLKQLLESSSVSVELSKKGFHREAITTVELRPDVLGAVRVLLVHRWPRGVYIDPYQLASLSDQSDWRILLDSAIDLELPAHKTSGFVTYVYPSPVGPTPRMLKVTIPVHGRYHEPSFDGKTFTSVDIGAPELLLRTEECTQYNSLGPHSIMEAPCTVSNSSTCLWVKVQHQQLGPMRFQFPVGDGSLVTPVCGGTLLATMICCVALSKYMWKHRLI
ncbi:phosphatidylinositol-glycan biosynthesis class X protein isoform X2 [Mugil cephalus]|uniref:phosphatidylinositol-glycan biosynthesis class X protein isoform X2 n=1 Tax=Mugil cephalus TaxID=48193 RepID=UPI001FB7F44A|nr:phosphatidylinositol-glycan biosynthesis class X protein isoform X2 [Mugil cephalus]